MVGQNKLLADLKRADSSIKGCYHITLPRGEYSHVPIREADAATGTGGLRGCWVLCARLWCGLCCLLRWFSSGCSAAVGLCRDEGAFNPVIQHCDGQAIYGDPHRFSCADQDLVRATLGRLKGAPFCTLPEEGMSRIYHVLVYKDIG